MSRPDWSREGRAWPLREHSRFVEAGRLRWHMQMLGAGPVALLLHGTGAATHSWRGLAPLLAEHFTVVSIDLPGHGFTSAPASGGFTLPAMARSVAALLEKLDIEPKITVGHSAGAAIAARLALDQDGNAPIVAVNGALLPFPGAARTIFPALARALFVNPLVPRLFALQGQSRRLVASFLERSTGSKIDAAGAALYQALFARSDHCAAALGMMANWDLDKLERELPALRAPLLLIAGDRDAAVPPSVSDRVAKRVATATVLHLSGLGHLAHEEAPDVVANAILDFATGHAILGASNREAPR